jgi:hypothetical protein
MDKIQKQIKAIEGWQKAKSNSKLVTKGLGSSLSTHSFWCTRIDTATQKIDISIFSG